MTKIHLRSATPTGKLAGPVMQQAAQGEIVDIGPGKPPFCWGAAREPLYFSGELDIDGNWFFVPEKDCSPQRAQSLWMKHIGGRVEVPDGNGGTRLERYYGVWERLQTERRQGAAEFAITADEMRELEREAALHPPDPTEAPVEEGEQAEVPAGYHFMWKGVPGRVLR